MTWDRCQGDLPAIAAAMALFRAMDRDGEVVFQGERRKMMKIGKRSADRIKREHTWHPCLWGTNRERMRMESGPINDGGPLGWYEADVRYFDPGPIRLDLFRHYGDYTECLACNDIDDLIAWLQQLRSVARKHFDAL